MLKRNGSEIIQKCEASIGSGSCLTYNEAKDKRKI